MANWPLAPKPAELAENRLLDSILDGSFPVNSTLPPERTLAEKLGVTRPTLREALQRLSREGWVEIHHGKPTRVKDYLKEGNLLILNSLALRPDKLSNAFISDLLQVRAVLAPEYGCLAVQAHAAELADLLRPMLFLPDQAEAYASADQDLHYRLTLLSGNPVFTLFLNGFAELEVAMGVFYFQNPAARQHSHQFYEALLECCEPPQPLAAQDLIRKVMQQSVSFWQGLPSIPQER